MAPTYERTQFSIWGLTDPSEAPPGRRELTEDYTWPTQATGGEQAETRYLTHS